MAEAFKEKFNKTLVTELATHLTKHVPNFDDTAFKRDACVDFQSLELKERANQITQALARYLPPNFDEAVGCLTSALHPDSTPDFDTIDPSLGITGWPIWPICDWVALKGINKPTIALPFLKELTCRFSAEFAIRPFIAANTASTLETLSGWLLDGNHHVRRLVSEGTRPRLPWGIQLRDFVADPAPILPLLEALKDDPSEYVRRSVANNLNDIAKDHPNLIATIAKSWLQGADKNREKLVKHGCRTLIKQGHMPTLKALGYKPVNGLVCDLTIETKHVNYGEALAFNILLDAEGSPDAIIDYAIHFVKKNGSRQPKVFKWKTGKLKKSTVLHRKHNIKPISTRAYYGGEHLLEIFVNGQSCATASFELIKE